MGITSFWEDVEAKLLTPGFQHNVAETKDTQGVTEFQEMPPAFSVQLIHAFFLKEKPS